MITKKVRQARILAVVRLHPVSSQGELSRLLESKGIEAAQSTLSRDIRELGLVKVRGLYHAAGNWNGGTAPDNLHRSLQQLVIERELSGNILMVKTAPGNAHALGVVLDGARWPEILGTVAGDDTVFALLRNARMGKKVLRRIEELMT